jgi:hypothetical protein
MELRVFDRDPKALVVYLCPQQTTGTNIKKLRDDTEPLHVRAEHSEIVRFLGACYRHRDRGCKLSVLCNVVQPQSHPSALALCSVVSGGGAYGLAVTWLRLASVSDFDQI